MNTISVKGKIIFDPDNLTKKHNSQSSWKKVAMVMFNDDLSDYYAWFIKKRFNLYLNPPQRGPHITFINDNNKNIDNDTWNKIKEKYNHKYIDIILTIEPKTDTKHWWLNIPVENRDFLHFIRREVGLDKPFYGLHMSIGYANEKNIEHSQYIHNLIKKKYILFG